MITLLTSPTSRRWAKFATLVILDSAATACSLFTAVFLRMNGEIPAETMAGLAGALPIFVVVSAVTFQMAGLYRRVWRFVSIADLGVIIEAVTIAIALSVLLLFALRRADWMPLSVPVIQWFILTVFLGSLRVMRRAVSRYLRSARRSSCIPTGGQTHRALIAGSPERVEVLIRHLEVEQRSGYTLLGILDDTGLEVRRRLRDVPILGGFDALDQVVEKLSAAGQRPECLILADGEEPFGGPQLVRLLSLAESLGLHVVRAVVQNEHYNGYSGREMPGEVQLRPVNLADLLGRPQAVLDSAVIRRAITGRRVLVSGAGGTIGKELVRQIAALRPEKLILLDSGEFNLYAVDLELRENFPEVPRVALLCCVRQRNSVMSVFEEHRPELVFHAAALKHVPLVEQNPCCGIQTNVLGTRNVADGVARYGARAMTQISTDKAVNPVGMMGATKRLGELYCQALDLAGQDQPDAPRFITVRFGNVLGSSGSLIPLFERQLSRRGPLTVTHPKITRYFMTVHEAAQLVLQSTALALEGAGKRGRIFVLDMGEPIKILDIAKRMIQLSGLKPETDVKIEFIGLRPGEKLYEELFDENEERLPSEIPRVFEARPNPIPLDVLNPAFDRLAMASDQREAETAQSEVNWLLGRDWQKVATVQHLPGSAEAPDAATTEPPPAAALARSV